MARRSDGVAGGESAFFSKAPRGGGTSYALSEGLKSRDALMRGGRSAHVRDDGEEWVGSDEAATSDDASEAWSDGVVDDVPGEMTHSPSSGSGYDTETESYNEDYEGDERRGHGSTQHKRAPSVEGSGESAEALSDMSVGESSGVSASTGMDSSGISDTGGGKKRKGQVGDESVDNSALWRLQPAAYLRGSSDPGNPWSPRGDPASPERQPPTRPVPRLHSVPSPVVASVAKSPLGRGSRPVGRNTA